MWVSNEWTSEGRGEAWPSTFQTTNLRRERLGEGSRETGGQAGWSVRLTLGKGATEHNLSGFAALLVKNPPANAGDARDMGWIPGSGRSPGVGNGHPLQYSWLENSMDREAWWATGPGGCKELDMTEHVHVQGIPSLGPRPVGHQLWPWAALSPP